MKIKKTRILFAFVLALVLQVSCTQSYRTAIPTPILAEVPKLLVRGEKHRLAVETSPGVECHAGVAYYDLNDKCINTSGFCSAIRSSAMAGPLGLRRPCSQS